MAVDVSTHSGLVHHTGRLQASVSTIALIAHHASETTVSVSNMSLVVHHTDQHQPVAVSQSAMSVHHTDEHVPVPIASVAIVVHRTIGHYMLVTPLPVEPEVPIGGVRVKPFTGEMMRQAYFNVLLTHAHTKEVRVDYTTVPGTAIPGTEYVTTQGTLVFEPGEVSKIVVVPVREYDEDISTNFTLLISSPLNANIVDANGLATI